MAIVRIISLLIPMIQLFGLIHEFPNLTDDYRFFTLAVFLFITTLYLAVSFCIAEGDLALSFSAWFAFTLVMMSFFIVAFGLLYEIFFQIFFPWPSWAVWFLIYLFYWGVLKSKAVKTKSGRFVMEKTRHEN